MNKLTIAVASGKGGTGKTTVSVNLANSISESNINLLDCDIEEPNTKLFFDKIKTIKSSNFAIPIPVIDETRCTYCGKCAEVCEYGAIAIIKKAQKTFVSEDLCHGCGACTYFCPEKAITEKPKYIGTVSKYEYKNIYITEGRLNIGETIATPLLKEVLKEINGLTILDAPPGTSCSMVTTVEKADFVILVTEPTPFGVHDLKLAIEVIKNLKKPFGIVVNKAELGNNEVYQLSKEYKIPIIMEIPFDTKIAEVYSQGKLITEAFPEYKISFTNMYNKIIKILEDNNGTNTDYIR